MKHTDLLIKSFEAFPNFVIINQYGRIIYISMKAIADCWG